MGAWRPKKTSPERPPRRLRRPPCFGEVTATGPGSRPLGRSRSDDLGRSPSATAWRQPRRAVRDTSMWTKDTSKSRRTDIPRRAGLSAPERGGRRRRRGGSQGTQCRGDGQGPIGVPKACVRGPATRGGARRGNPCETRVGAA